MQAANGPTAGSQGSSGGTLLMETGVKDSAASLSPVEPRQAGSSPPATQPKFQVGRQSGAGRAEQGRAGRGGQGRAGQGRAGQGRAKWGGAGGSNCTCIS